MSALSEGMEMQEVQCIFNAIWAFGVVKKDGMLSLVLVTFPLHLQTGGGVSALIAATLLELQTSSFLPLYLWLAMKIPRCAIEH